MKLKTFPKYMYHKDHNEPIRVDSKAEQTDKENLGWTTARLFKEFPKWVGDKIVHSKAEEERLLASTNPQPKEVVLPDFGEEMKVVKETQVDSQDTAVVEKPNKKSVGRPKKT